MDLTDAHISQVAYAINKIDGNLKVVRLNRVSMNESGASKIAQAIGGDNCLLETLDLSSKLRLPKA
jgi:hypothetical protein